MELIVLMSTYNGEKYIKEQLDSLINQELRPTQILIRDDGSKDNTVNILEDYSSRYSFIKYYCGHNKKPAKSFFELINTCDQADYYALCDQDDVWFKNKLSTAVNTLEKEDKNIPLLYCSKYTLTDENLNPLDSNVSNLYNYSDFAHSLLYHTAPGCTFVFNNEARKQIVKYDLDKEYYLIHDAIVHKVVTMFGKMILDNNSYMYYRQHSSNEIGMSANKAKVFFSRVKHFLTGSIKGYRSKTAKSLLNVYGDICSKENKELLQIVANYKDNKQYKKQLLNDPRFKVEGINYLLFRILVIFNYI